MAKPLWTPPLSDAPDAPPIEVPLPTPKGPDDPEASLNPNGGPKAPVHVVMDRATGEFEAFRGEGPALHRDRASEFCR